MTEPNDNQVADLEDGVDQRTVSADAAPPLRIAAASSVFNWRGPGTAAATQEEPAADPPPEADLPPTTTPEKEEPMAQKKRGAAGATRSKRGGPQMEICQLLATGDHAREAIASALPRLQAAQISSALNNSKSQGRIAWIEKEQVYRLTAAGKEWVGAAADGDDQAPATKTTKRSAGRSKAHARQRAAKEQPQEPEGSDTSPPAFRCGVMSDGCFFITKDGNAIELDAGEHAQMLAYLERMAVEG